MLDDYSVLYRNEVVRNAQTAPSAKDLALVRIQKASSVVKSGAKKAAPYALPALGVAVLAGIAGFLFAPQTKDARKEIGSAAKSAAKTGKRVLGDALHTADNFDRNYPEVVKTLLDNLPGGKPASVVVKARRMMRKFG